MNNMSYRDVCISLLLLVLCGCKTSSKPSSAQDKQGKPNIILIVADDLTWQDSAPYGNDEVKTPNLTRLADEGMTFYGMHTSTAMCSPTRQQLYSGMFPVRNGAYPNHSWSYDGVKSLPQYLRPLGYRVGIAGKHDVGPPDSYPFKDVGPKGAVNKKSLAAIQRFITKDSSPFALVVASHQPHKHWNKGDQSQYDPSELSVPNWLVHTPTTRKQLSKYYAEVTYLDHQVGQVMDLLKYSGKKKNTIVLVTSEQGAQFPFAKWTCYENGLKTSFIARWPDKVETGTENHALLQYVDVVPTLIDAAGGDPDTLQTGRRDALGHTGFDGKSFLQVMLDNKPQFRDYVYGVQTTLGIIGAQRPYPIRSVYDGRYKLIKNLNADAEFSNITKTRDKALIQSWIKTGKNDSAVAARAAFYYKRPEVEFYDIKNDPNELHNLAGDPKYDATMAKLNKTLNTWMTQQGDKGLPTEKEYKSRMARNLRGKKK